MFMQLNFLHLQYFSASIKKDELSSAFYRYYILPKIRVNHHYTKSPQTMSIEIVIFYSLCYQNYSYHAGNNKLCKM